MSLEYILFDLDGTLTDPAIGITNAVMHALKKYGIAVSDRKELYKFIGPPLWDSFEKYCGFSKEEANTAVEYYREYYRDKGMFENQVYDGCEGLLKELKDNGKILIVATSKPEVFAEQILEHFGIAKYFTFIAGSTLDGSRVKKGDVIRYALESCNIIDGSQAIMIGDREHDIIGAKEMGLSSIGVLFGYGSRAELEEAGADFIVSTIEDIGKVILAK
ncbi:MAG TPA: phosphoglycolate phosphatase [Firmicutes bacterium]|jgi:phosphoglycolate phosphatase|nr:phosphoglycolate phosphatase [Bacillota bacterium]HCF89884.1 phosphoglycolate phosphatase [Bacillota bacterium]